MAAPKVFLINLLSVCLLPSSSLLAVPSVTLESRPAEGQWSIKIDGQQALTYHYGADVDLPHHWPLNSPSGENHQERRVHPAARRQTGAQR